MKKNEIIKSKKEFTDLITNSKYIKNKEYIIYYKDNNLSKKRFGIAMILMPLLMAFFTLLYTTMFSLYMITGQLVTLATTPLIDLINDKIDKIQEQKKIPKDRLKRI